MIADRAIKIDFNYILSHKDFTLALCSFLDEFRRTANKYAMIESPPPSDGASRESLSLLAAVAHKLANDFDVDVPGWVHDPLYIMPYPVFAFNTQNKEYQEFLRKDAPPEFASKNIFHSSGAIERV